MLLPEANAPTLGGYGDAMSSVYALMSEIDRAEGSAAKEDVTEKTSEKHAQIAKEQDALAKQKQKEADAQSESHGFWGSVAKVAGVVADVGVVIGATVGVVCTGGALLPVAVATLSVTSLTLKATGALDKLGVAGALIEGGVGVACGGIGIFAGGASAIASAIDGGAAIAGGTSSAATGVVTVRTSDDHAGAQDAAANATDARCKAEQRQRLTEDVIAALKETHASHQKALTALAGAMNQEGQTMVAITSATGRA